MLTHAVLFLVRSTHIHSFFPYIHKHLVLTDLNKGKLLNATPVCVHTGYYTKNIKYDNTLEYSSITEYESIKAN